MLDFKELINQNGFVDFRNIYMLDDNVDVAIHPVDYKKLRDNGFEFFDEASWDDIKQKGKYGYVKNKNIDIYVSTLVEKGKMCVIHRD